MSFILQFSCALMVDTTADAV